MQKDDYLTWSQIIEKIDELLCEDVPRQPYNRFQWAKSDNTKKSVEILQHGARRIKLNWNWEE